MYAIIRMKYGYPEYESVPGSTFEDLYKYVKEDKDVSRVVIPHTFYGYGASFIDRANSEWLTKHYPRAVKDMCFKTTISRWKFLHSSGEELRELIAMLAEDYPLIDDETHSRIEWEEKESSFEDWAASEIDTDMTPDQIRDVMEYCGIELSELLLVDTDGATIYMPKEQQATIQHEIAELSANQ